jgi:hypothetical protein
MTWYAAHTIVTIRPIKPDKGEIGGYENVILVEANNEHEAINKARKYAQDSIPEDESLKVDGKPAIQSFIGIRKIVAVTNPWPLSQDADRPVDGTEITYSKFAVKDERALSKLVNGEEVLIHYLE